MSDLDRRLLVAHESGDGRALARLYEEAAETAATEDATAFYLTHAYIWALDTGDPKAPALRARLAEMHRI